MKVCIVIPSIDKSLGGPSRSVPILAKGLSFDGISTTLLTQTSRDMNDHILDGSGVELIAVPKKNGIKALENIIINGNFDILHLQNLWDPFLHKIAKIARKHNIPYLMTPRGTLEPWSLQQKKLKKKLALAIYQKKDLQRAACELATSQMEATNIRNIGIKPPIAIIPNGIDFSEYTCRDVSFRNKVKKQIVFLSRIHKKKGIELLIQAWKTIHDHFSDWNIVIAGNGDSIYIDNLQNIICDLELQDSVSIIPPVFGENKKNLYQTSSIFILPTYSENFGMVIAEAMSCGIPVITTNGTPWQDLNKLEIGWCIDLSVKNIAKALTDAIESGSDKLFDMGQKASRYVNDNYNYLKIAKRIGILYNWLFNNIEKPDWII